MSATAAASCCVLLTAAAMPPTGSGRRRRGALCTKRASVAFRPSGRAAHAAERVCGGVPEIVACRVSAGLRCDYGAVRHDADGIPCCICAHGDIPWDPLDKAARLGCGTCRCLPELLRNCLRILSCCRGSCAKP